MDITWVENSTTRSNRTTATQNETCTPVTSANVTVTVFVTLPPSPPGANMSCPAAALAAFESRGMNVECEKIVQGTALSPPPPLLPPSQPENATNFTNITGLALPTHHSDPVVIVTTSVMTPWLLLPCLVWCCFCLCRRQRKKQKPAFTRKDVNDGRLVVVSLIQKVRVHTVLASSPCWLPLLRAEFEPLLSIAVTGRDFAYF